MQNPYIVSIGLSLLVALYMFAAIPFPALRFIFRLKRFAARATGTSDEQNRQLGDKLGLMLCPILGIAALGFAVHFSLGWKKVTERKRAHAEALEKRAELASELLATSKVGNVTIGHPRLQRVTTDAGKTEIEKFLHELSPTITPASLRPGYADGSNDVITIDLQTKVGASFPQVQASPKTGSLRLTSESGDWGVKVPDALRDSLSALGRIEQIDLIAIKRAEDEKKAKEARKLSNYQEATHQGPASWQIYDAIAAEPEENRSAKCAEYASTPIDWELEVSSMKDEGEQVRVSAYQSRKPAPGASSATSPGVQLLVPKTQIADIQKRTDKTWLRVSGKVDSVSLSKTKVVGQIPVKIHLQVENLTAFQPDVSKIAD